MPKMTIAITQADEQKKIIEQKLKRYCKTFITKRMDDKVVIANTALYDLTTERQQKVSSTKSSDFQSADKFSFIRFFKKE